MGSIYRVIDNHPNYVVTDTGEIFSNTDTGLKELKQDISNGYPRVKLDGEKIYVASVVAETFLDPPSNPNQKIFHIDGNKLNCDKSNLIWLSQSEIQRYSQYTIEYRKEILGEW